MTNFQLLEQRLGMLSPLRVVYLLLLQVVGH
jgi:hypothetical protein